MQSRIKDGLFQGVDFLAVLYYLLLVAAGCICITAASFDEETADFFAFSHFYIKQYMWVTAVLVVALVVLLLDVRYYHMWAYPLYIIGIVVMIGVLIAGKEVNGAKSWIELGSLRIQPVEFVKIATALALARVMSNYSFCSPFCKTTPVRASCWVHSSSSSTAKDSTSGSASRFCSSLRSSSFRSC